MDLKSQAQLLPYRIKLTLANPYFPLATILVAALLMAPCLNEGLFLDDWFQRLKITGNTPIEYSEKLSTVGQFNFIQGNAQQMQAAIDIGLFPWWSFESLKLSFWRPLTEITHLLDYRLWPDNPLLMHLHNLLWYGLIIFLLSQLYKRLMGSTWVAGLAILLFSLDSAHSMPVAWLANRNALLATCFGLGALLLHDRWRKDGFASGGILAPMLLGCSLLSAEFGIGICAYIFAYAVFIDPKDSASRVFSLLPYALVTVPWWILYTCLGYGAAGSGNYIDPAGDPLRFLGAMIDRFPVLLHGQIGLFGANLYKLLSPNLTIVFWCIAVLVLALLFVFLLPLLRTNNVARFWGLGMILSLLPVISAMPDNRLLLLAGIGGMGLLAQFFSAWFEQSDVYSRTRTFRLTGRILVTLLLVVHLVVAPISKARDAQFYQNLHPVIDNPAADPNLTPDHRHQTIIALNPPGSYLFFHYVIVKIFNQRGQITPYQALANAESKLIITRTDERTVEVIAENGYYTGIWDLFFRDPQNIMPTGHQVKTGQMKATVLSLTKKNIPRHVRFEFDRPLEDEAYKFIFWNADRYDRFQLPAIGQTNYIEKAEFLRILGSR